MEFLINYWSVLLIAFILILLVILAYLIDGETKKIGKDKRISFKLKEKEEIKESKQAMDAVTADLESSYDELDYDELDIENIDDEFNKIIPKKKIINDNIKDSIEKIKLEPIKFENVGYSDDIELPDIRLKKKKQENIWGK